MSLQQPPQIPISIGLAPQQAQGARMVGPIQLTFVGVSNQFGLTTVVNDDLILEGEDGTINNIQSLYFDSSACPIPIELIINDTQQSIILPAKCQGYLPVLATNSLRYTAFGYGGGALAGASYTVELSFLNVPCAAQIWSTMPSQNLVSSLVNAGNATLSLATNNNGVPIAGAGLGSGRDTYIYGFDVTGTGATAEAPVTATLTNIAGLGYAGATETVSFVIDVPVLGASVNFTRRFEPPLRATRTAANIPNTVTLSVPAMGAGQTAAGAVLYYGVA